MESNSIPLKTWLLLISMGVLIFLMNIDYTAVNLTLIPISIELNEDLNNLQWILSGYVLVWAAFVIPAGRIADIYGKRNTLIGGLLLFMLGSCLTGLGHDLTILISGRLIQGIGAAIFTAPCWALIFTSSPPEKQGFIMGLMLSCGGIGLAIGPTLGGYIIENFMWRWIYYVNIPVGLTVIGILSIIAKNDRDTNTSSKIDFFGAAFLALGLCLIVFGLNQIEVWGLADYRLWVVISLGISMLIAFYYRDRKQAFRLIPKDILNNKTYMAISFSEFFMSMCFSQVLVLIGLYLQNTKEYSSYETGKIFLAMTVSMGILSPFGGKIVDKLGVKALMICGGLTTALAMAFFSSFTTHTSLPFILFALCLAGAGIGGFFTACNTAMMRSVPEKDLNIASGVFTMFMMMGNTLSIVLSTSLLVLLGRYSLFKKLEEHNIFLDLSQREELAKVISMVEHTPDQLKTFPKDQSGLLLDLIGKAFINGFSFNMILGILWAIVAVALIILGVKKLAATNAATQILH